MKAKKRQLPSNDEIENKKQNLRDLFQKVANGEIEPRSKTETVSDKLMLVTEELLLLKDKGIPYSIMARLIEENLGLKVSDQTLRKFCQTMLGFPKKTRKYKTKKSPVIQETNYSATEALSQTNDFD